LTRDGIERTDVLAVATHLQDRPSIELQVKTATLGQGLTSWLLGTKAQSLARSNREWFLFVLLPKPPAPPRGFVVPRNHVVAAAWVVHQNWFTDPSVPPGRRNTPLSRARVNETVWADYEDRWDLLDMSTRRCRSCFRNGFGSGRWRSGSGCRQVIHGRSSCLSGDIDALPRPPARSLSGAPVGSTRPASVTGPPRQAKTPITGSAAPDHHRIATALRTITARGIDRGAK
jgi:hypothetical protein